MKVKGWSKFQHFKDRKPPWIKLYRDLLDDLRWHELDPKSAKLLISLWLLASEDEKKEGELPDDDTICFRLRITKRDLKSNVSHLSHWLIQDDINVISDIGAISPGYQQSRLETETETETDVCSFDVFWKAYPRKVAKEDAIKAWTKLKVNAELAEKIMAALERFKVSPDWVKDKGEFIPYPASWLNGHRFNDELPTAQPRKVAW